MIIKRFVTPEQGNLPPFPARPDDTVILGPGPLFESIPGRLPPERQWGSLHRFIDRYRDRDNLGITRYIADDFLHLGFWPLLIRPQGKAPLQRVWSSKPPTTDLFRWADRNVPTANLGLMIGAKGGLVDLDIDDPERATTALSRMFPGGLPPTLGWYNANGRFHLLFRWEERVATYGRTVIKGQVVPDGKIIGNAHYLGLELRLGGSKLAGKSLYVVIPPSKLADGTPRRWNDGQGIWPLPESVYADLDTYLTGHSRGLPSLRAGCAAEECQKKLGWQT